jgi:hypothetical protein
MIRGNSPNERAHMLLMPLSCRQQPAFIMLVAASSGQLRESFCLRGGGVQVSLALEDVASVCVEDVSDDGE